MAANWAEEAWSLVPGRAASGLGRTVTLDGECRQPEQRGDEVCGRVGEDPLRRRAPDRRGEERRSDRSGRGNSWVYAGSGKCGARVLDAVTLALWAAAASRSKDHFSFEKSLLVAAS